MRCFFIGLLFINIGCMAGNLIPVPPHSVYFHQFSSIKQVTGKVAFIGCQGCFEVDAAPAHVEKVMLPFIRSISRDARTKLELVEFESVPSFDRPRPFFDAAPDKSPRYELYWGSHNHALIYDGDVDSVSPSLLQYLNKHYNGDYYMVATLNVSPESLSLFSADHQVRLVVSLYDKTGCAVYSRIYSRNCAIKGFGAIPLGAVVMCFDQLVADNAQTINRDLKFLENADTPKGRTLEDLYREYDKVGEKQTN